MASTRQYLRVASLGALVALSDGFNLLPACVEKTTPAGRRCFAAPVGTPASGLHVNVRSGTLHDLRRRKVRHGILLQASEDGDDREVTHPELGVVTPGAKGDLEPYVARIPTHSKEEGEAGSSEPSWRIFHRKYDREIVSMAVPSYTAVLLDPIATLIDVTFIGRLPDSTLSLAGVGISNTILNYFSFLFFFMVVTTTTTVAQALAESSSASSSTEFEGQLTVEGMAEGSRIIAGSILCSLAMGVASATISWEIPASWIHNVSILPAFFFGTVFKWVAVLAPQLVAFIGSSRSADAAAYAVAYMRHKCLGIPAMIVFFSVIGAFRGYKDLRTPLIGNIFSSITKVVLGYVFLFQMHLGVAGAGLADAMARYLSLGVLLALLVSTGRLRLGDLVVRPAGNLIKDLVTPGGALTARKFIEQICFTMTMRVSASFGATAVASAEIARQCWSVLSILWWPLSVAGQTLVAAALAEFAATQRQRKLVLARGIAIRVMFISSLLGTFGAAVLVTGRDLIPSLMTPHAAVQALSAMQLPFLALIMPVTAMCDVVESCFIAAKDYKVVLQAMLCGAIALALTIGVCLFFEVGVRTQWLAILALYCARLAVGMFTFNSARSSIPREKDHPVGLLSEQAARA